MLIELASVRYSQDREEPNQQEFNYTAQYIPSLEQFDRKIFCFNELDFMKLINKWNRSSDVWKYYI